MVKHLPAAISQVFPFSLLSLLARPRVVAPFYHLVSNETPLHLKHLYRAVSPKQFIKDLDFLLGYFTPIDVRDIPLILKNKNKLLKPALFLSFDDGFRELATEVAPILLQKGVPATIFVSPAFVGNKDMLYRCKLSLIAEKVKVLGESFTPPDFLVLQWGKSVTNTSQFIKRLFSLGWNDHAMIEQIAQSLDVDIKGYLQREKPYLTVEELNDLSLKGFTVGAHSVNHPNFFDIPFENQILEVMQSLAWVQVNIPNQPRIFAFPFTNWGVSKEFYRYFFADYSQAFSMMFGTAGYKPTSSMQLLHRIPMEGHNFSARQVVGGEFLYYLAKIFVGKHKEYLPV